MKAIQVFCGSSLGNKQVYIDAAKRLGEIFLERQIDLVYGAGNVGLMGIIANTMLAGKGTVIGVIPEFLMAKEVGHSEISELILVDGMHTRKVEMYKRAEGTIVLPGGFGTLDELFEMLTLAQLEQHPHPIGILNINGYFDLLIQQLDHMVEEQFLRPFHREILLSDADPEALLKKMAAYEPATNLGKWWEE
ncbi:MAG TPA: TIGR00730 family Rossman fold protein [Saprospiraceae bacterium]|nr:TIGR00730 family Rossman fold protein [Saprospiraceae bacterium]